MISIIVQHGKDLMSSQGLRKRGEQGVDVLSQYYDVLSQYYDVLSQYYDSSSQHSIVLASIQPTHPSNRFSQLITNILIVLASILLVLGSIQIVLAFVLYSS